jgi:outer membrane protein OmpA-like peptidoglycan-associated protein
MTSSAYRSSSSAAALLLLALSAPAGAQQTPQRPIVAAEPAGAPAIVVAQQGDKDDGKDHKKKGPPNKGKGPPNNQGAGGGQQGGGGPQGGGNNNAAAKAKADALRQQQIQAQQAKQKALQQKQQADQARQNAIKQQLQLKAQQAQQAKQKALQQKQQADQARQNAIKQQQQLKAQQAQQAQQKALQQKQQADQARQNAIKQKQLEAQQALKDKKEAERQNAIKQQQLEAQRAQQQKIQAEQARQNAIRQQQIRAKQAKGPPPKFDRSKVDNEFDRARKAAQAKRDGNEKWRAGSDSKFEALRKGRKTREVGSRNVIIENDNRVIIQNNNRTYIRHDESRRLQRVGRELRRERQKNGALMVVTMGLAGALIYSLQDDDGRVLRRTRRDRDGREIVLLDNRHYYDRHHHRGEYGYAGFGAGPRYYDTYVDVPPPVVRIPREKYIVEYDQASTDDIYDALNAPPVEDLDRGYSLDEVRQSYGLLERMRRVDLDTVTFEFGSWEVGPDQYRKLERMADAIKRILDRSPGEMFLIEGHTDAVGSEIDNLSLSDRRAETVAVVLTEEFGVPPENLTTQGYGESHLKVLTEDPSRINRRVAVRRITPLLSREGWNDPD